MPCAAYASQVSAASCLFQLPPNAPGKAVKLDPSSWAPASIWETLIKFGQVLTTAVIWKMDEQMKERALCLICLCNSVDR